MSKGRCPSRAEWRFELGKPAKQLSPHYVLDCDHGTAMMVCWEQGGDEPVYLCSSHAEEQKRKSENRAGRKSAGPDADSACGKARLKEEAPPEAHSKNSSAENGGEARAPETRPEPARPVEASSETIEVHGAVSKPAEPAPESLKEGGAAPDSRPEKPVVADSIPLIPEETVVKAGERLPEPPIVAVFAADSAQPEAPAAKPGERISTAESMSNGPANPSPKRPVLPPAAVKAVRSARDSSARLPARDLVFGNPAKAIVDEAIWNLAVGDHQAFCAAIEVGKPVGEAAQAAGGQIAAIHRRIAEYSLKLDAILSVSAKSISVQEAIDFPLEQAMIEIIESDLLTDEEKDAAIQQLGTLQEWAKYGLQARINPLVANRGLVAVGDRVNWGGATEASQRLKPAYRALFASLKKAIHASAPDAQELHERLINLRAAKSDLLAVPAPELLSR